MEINTESQSSNNSRTDFVDDVRFMCDDRMVMRYGDIRKRLLSTHTSAEKRLSEIHRRQNELHAAYREYLDLQEDAKRYGTRMARIAALLSESADFENIQQSQRDGKDVSGKVAVVASSATPLWEFIVTILEETGEIQVVELELILKELKRQTTRPAIESAFKAHPNEFKIRGNRHGKFVSLKGA